MIAAIQLQGPLGIVSAMLLLSIVLAAIAWCYQSQLASARGQAIWALPLLRAAAFGALVFAFLEPQIVTPVHDQQSGTVAILVDQSRSMTSVDSTRSPSELVQLAAALGALPSGVRSSAMSDVRDAVQELVPIAEEIERSESEERYARLAGRGIEAAEKHLRDAQNELRRRVGELAPDAPQSLSSMLWLIDGDSAAGRIADVIARIDQLQAEADDQLFRQNPQVQQICHGLAASSRLELVSMALDGESGTLARISEDRPVKVQNVTETTSPTTQPSQVSFTSAVRVVREAQGDRRLAAVVVLSDGQPATGVPRDLGIDASTPVFVVSAAASRVGDMAIDRVWVPQRVFAGQTLYVGVDIRVVGIDAADAEVTVECGGRRQTQRAPIVEGHARARVPLSVESPGPQELKISVKPLAGEATLENNRVNRVVRVVSDRIHVAVLAGKPTRDFEYLRDALKEDPGVVAIERAVDAPARAFTPEQLMDQDVVVLVELPQAALDSRQWDALIRLVNEKGGSVIIATTDPFIAAGYASNPLAAGLLPWRGETQPDLSAWPGAEAVFRIVPATTSGGEPVRLWDESEPGSPRWSDLPPVFRFLGLPPLRNAAQALLIDRDSGLPVLAQLRSGAGRALFLGLDELWRWRGELDYEHTNRLYAHLIHQDSCPQYAVRSGELAVDAEPLVAQPGQPVHVRARAEAGATIDLLRGEVTVYSRPLIQDPNKPFGEATFTGLSAGEYRIRLRAPNSNSEATLPLWVRDNTEDEMRDVSSDPVELRRLAGARGEVLSLSEVHTLPARLSRLKEPAPVLVQTRLWDSPYMYLFVVACLGLEWALRKRFGLA